jgi:hypothetical protein
MLQSRACAEVAGILPDARTPPIGAVILKSILRQRIARRICSAPLGHRGFASVKSGGGNFRLAHAQQRRGDLFLVVIPDRRESADDVLGLPSSVVPPDCLPCPSRAFRGRHVMRMVRHLWTEGKVAQFGMPIAEVAGD